MFDSSSHAVTATVLFAGILLVIVIASMIQVAIVHRRTAARTVPLPQRKLVAISQGSARYRSLLDSFQRATRLRYGILVVALLLVTIGLIVTAMDEEVGLSLICTSFPLLALIGLYPMWLKLRLESYAGRLTPAERETSQPSA